MGRTRRTLAIVGLLAATLAASLAMGAPSPAAAQTPPPEPIVFVHGWSSSPSTWNTMRSRFVAAGFPANRLFAFGYNTGQSNKTSAAQLNTYIDQVRAQTGSPVVDVVAHSQGGLVARWCMKASGCNGKVDDWVSLAGANHGTLVSLCFWSAGCREMFYNSDFVKALNATDETPGSATYTALWSDKDAVILPNASAQLASGARNIRVPIGHNDFPGSQAVFNTIRPIVVE
ncbi:MAG: alpha/beta fold hydrolase [Acidimicrobiales bacterium]|nr:alpha/beta fold hydrolase [Acidimicrobiales bacterium]